MSPDGCRRLHFWLTVFWLAFAVPCVAIEGWRESVPLLVFVSVYANAAGHFSAWQASRAEQLVDEDD